MKHNLYPKLAWTGIRKNSRLYLPYILTCIGMVMMFYIVSFLSSSEYLASCKGGKDMQMILELGCGVIGFFAAIFLFYTNSFLMRRRKKEFGLYNILGMGKWNIARVLLWETFMIAVISIVVGSVGGILLSKVAELCMINILGAEALFFMRVDTASIGNTVILFSIIFVLILLNALRQLHFANPIELLHSENTGERPPRANWIFAILGAGILGGAYYLAVTLENPLEVIMLFFVAVIMVIVATYLLFIAGSVTICKALQKNKKYYYRTNHFVSVSSMVYRMKRNGAGLASICILCTMVLVMVSSTVCLYVGKEESMRERYPRDINLRAGYKEVNAISDKEIKTIQGIVAETLSEYQRTEENRMDYLRMETAAIEKDGVFRTEDPGVYGSGAGKVWQIYLIPLEDYNRLMGENEELSGREVLLYTTRKSYKKEKIFLGGHEPFTVKKNVDFVDDGEATMTIVPSMFIMVKDFDGIVEEFGKLVNYAGDSACAVQWIYAFDLAADDEEQVEIHDKIKKKVLDYLKELTDEDSAKKVGITSISFEGAAKERETFYALFGGLFFLGILLGIVFVFAAVLIMYYKQISEGYEDQARFEIMQKVGMTKSEIRKSVNSQVITVFFLPLVAAGMHLSFAFPMVQKCLLLFGLVDVKLLVLVTLICFLVFAILYVLAYRVTSHSYYSIVSGGRES
jgi:putative ABC transport system permease protein